MDDQYRAVLFEVAMSLGARNLRYSNQIVDYCDHCGEQRILTYKVYEDKYQCAECSTK